MAGRTLELGAETRGPGLVKTSQGVTKPLKSTSLEEEAVNFELKRLI